MPFQKVIGSLRAGYTVVVVASKRHEARGERRERERRMASVEEVEKKKKKKEKRGLGSERTNIDGRYVLSWATNP